MKLYELSQAYKTLSVLVDNPEEFNTEAIQNELAQVKVEFNDKVENIAKFMLECKAEETILSTEIERLEQRKKVASGKYDWFKNYLTIELENAKVDKVKGLIVTTLLKANYKPTVNIIDASKVPQDLCEFHPAEYVPSKTKALEYFKANQGVVPDGFEIITDKKHVTIK